MVQFLLNVVVFVSGAVLMGSEIVGSRVLAPYFGNSIFVWGSLISVVMAALSVGYYWGGWLSAREPSYCRLLTLLLIPGVLIFFLPFIYPTVNEWIAAIDFGTRLNPLIASSALFPVAGSFFGNHLALRHTSGGDHNLPPSAAPRNALCGFDLRQYLRHPSDCFLLDTAHRRQQYHSLPGGHSWSAFHWSWCHW